MDCAVAARGPKTAGRGSLASVGALWTPLGELLLEADEVVDVEHRGLGAVVAVGELELEIGHALGEGGQEADKVVDVEHWGRGGSVAVGVAAGAGFDGGVGERGSAGVGGLALERARIGRAGVADG